MSAPLEEKLAELGKTAKARHADRTTTGSSTSESTKKRRPGRPCKYPKPPPEPRLGIATKPKHAGSLMELETTAHKWIKRMLTAFQKADHLLLRVDAAGLTLYPEDGKTQARFQGAQLNRFYAPEEIFCGRISRKKLAESLNGLDNSDHIIALTLKPGGTSLEVDIRGNSRRSTALLDVEKAESPSEINQVWKIPSPNEPPQLQLGSLQFDVAFRIPAIQLKKVYGKFSSDRRTLQLTYEDDYIVFQQEKDESRKEYISRNMVELVIDENRLTATDLTIMVTAIDQLLLQAIVPTHNADEESVIISSTRNGKLLIEKVDQTGGYGIRIGVGC